MDVAVCQGSRKLAGLAGGVAITLAFDVLPAPVAMWISGLVYLLLAISTGLLLAAGRMTGFYAIVAWVAGAIGVWMLARRKAECLLAGGLGYGRAPSSPRCVAESTEREETIGHE